MRKLKSIRVSPKNILIHSLSLTLILLTCPTGAEAQTPSREYNYDFYSNAIQGGQWGNSAIELNRVKTPDSVGDLLVAVVDTGIDGTHPYLAQSVLKGWDFVSNKEIPSGANSDDGGHGTHVAGIIGSKGAIKGVASGVKFMPVKVLDSGGGGDDSTVSKGVDYAVDNGADVINLSLGSRMDPFEKPDSKTCVAITRAYKKGVGVIVASGNSGASGNALSSLSMCEGSYNIGAVDQELKRSYFSNFDSTVNLVAPGSAILSTIASGDTLPYASWSGTSMATPFVTGAYILKLATNPKLKPNDIYKALSTSALDLGPKGSDPQFGAGLLNLPNLLDAKASTISKIKKNITSTSLITIKSVTVTDKGTSIEVATPSGSAIQKMEVVVLSNGFNKVKSEDQECQRTYDMLYQIFTDHPNGNDYTNEMVRGNLEDDRNIYKIIREILPSKCNPTDVNKFITASFRPYSVSSLNQPKVEKNTLSLAKNKVFLKNAVNTGSFLFITGYDKAGNPYFSLPTYDFIDERSKPKEEINKILAFQAYWLDGLLHVEYQTSKTAPVNISIMDYESGFFKYDKLESSPFILSASEASLISAHSVTISLSTGTASTEKTLQPLYGFDYKILTAGPTSLVIKGRSTLCNYNKKACSGQEVELVDLAGNVIAKSLILDSLGYFFNIDNLNSFEGVVRSGENKSEVIKWSR